MSSEQLKAHIQPSFLDAANLAQCLLAAKQLLTFIELRLEGQRLQRNRAQRKILRQQREYAFDTPCDPNVSISTTR